MAISVYHDQIKSIISNRLSNLEFVGREKKDAKKKRKDLIKEIDDFKASWPGFRRYQV